MVYTVTFNPALDYIMQVDKLQTSGIIRANECKLCIGGKGINVSQALNEFEIDNIALGLVAGFTGEQLTRLACDKGIKAEFVQTGGLTRINVKVKDSDNAELAINADGCNVSASDIDTLVRSLGRAKAGDWIIMSGSVPSSVEHDIYGRIMSLLPKGIRFVVDSTRRLLQASLAHSPYLVKPNAEELGQLFDTYIDDSDTDNIRLYATRLVGMGAQNVLVSRGASGAMLVSKDGVIESTSPKVKVVSSVAAGDSMVAGFVAGMIRSNDVSQALRYGIAAGAASVQCEGVATMDNIKTIFEQHNGGKKLL